MGSLDVALSEEFLPTCVHVYIYLIDLYVFVDIHMYNGQLFIRYDSAGKYWSSVFPRVNLSHF